MLTAALSLSSTAFVAPTLRTNSMRSPSVVMAEKVEMPTGVLERDMELPVTGKVQAEYIWIDAEGDVRSKCKTVSSAKAALDQLPSWNYDGSSTDQAPGEDSEVIIKPRAVYKDPFGR